MHHRLKHKPEELVKSLAAVMHPFTPIHTDFDAFMAWEIPRCETKPLNQAKDNTIYPQIIGTSNRLDAICRRRTGQQATKYSVD